MDPFLIFLTYHSTVVNELALDHQGCSSNNLILASVLNDGDKVIPAGFHLRKAG